MLDEAAASTLAFFLKKKEEAIKANHGNPIIISIAVVSEGGQKNLVSEMCVASLNATYPRKSSLLKIVKVNGKEFWKNPSPTDQWGIDEAGFLLYDAKYRKRLAEHVEEYLHLYVLSIQEKEPIRLLQRFAGQGGCQSGGPYKVGMKVFNCDKNGKLPHDLIWRDDLPPNVPYFEVNIKKCEPKDLVEHLMTEKNYNAKMMKDYLNECIKSIPAELQADAGLDNAGLDDADTEDDASVDIVDLTNNDAEDVDTEDDASDDIVDLTNESKMDSSRTSNAEEDDASNDIVDPTNDSEIDSRCSSKRARQKPDWYAGLRGEYFTDDKNE